MSRFSCRILLLLAACVCAGAFCSPPRPRSSSFQGTALVLSKPLPPSRQEASLRMFLGNEGGILGVGAPEVFTILLVGYFVLGPSDLYKLVKEVGKSIQNFRTLSSDLSKTFESNMESQLELNELRKAQQELNDAFSFRRSINVNQEAEAFETPQRGDEPTVAAKTEGAPTKKKKIKRRRVKKKVEEPANGNIPDLDMPAMDDTSIREEEERLRAEEERLRAERRERLKTGTQPDTPMQPVSEPTAAEQDRFAQQLSGDWNKQILDNEDKLSPLSQIMEQLAILEEEKVAADARLEEEFRLRGDLEEKYYREKRQLLEEAAAEVQAQAYVSVDSGDDKKKA